jgi:hypothetical protein
MLTIKEKIKANKFYNCTHCGETDCTNDLPKTKKEQKIKT